MNKNYIWFGLGISVLTIFAAILFTRSDGNSPDINPSATTPVPTLTTEVLQIVEEDDTQKIDEIPEKNVTITRMQNDVTKLITEDLVDGTGEEAIEGKTVTVNYKGTLTDGTQFDSSYDRGQPFSFTLGAGEVIKGWDQGVAGMKVGGKRELTIPPDLGYGSRDMGTIPPNSVLVFEVELLGVE